MTPEDVQLYSDLKRVLDGATWARLLKPALEQERDNALAGMSDERRQPAERGEFARAYNVAVRLLAVLPDRLAQFERIRAALNNREASRP